MRPKLPFAGPLPGAENTRNFGTRRVKPNLRRLQKFYLLPKRTFPPLAKTSIDDDPSINLTAPHNESRLFARASDKDEEG